MKKSLLVTAGFLMKDPLTVGCTLVAQLDSTLSVLKAGPVVPGTQPG